MCTRAGIEICDKKLKDLRPVPYAQRQKYLTERLKHHRKQENEKTQRNIEQMMNREETYLKWNRLRCTAQVPWSQAASQVAIQDEYGQQIVVLGKAPLNNAVANSLNERYRAACDTPISSGKLLHNLGHLANTVSTEDLLCGDIPFLRNVTKQQKPIYER